MYRPKFNFEEEEDESKENHNETALEIPNSKDQYHFHEEESENSYPSHLQKSELRDEEHLDPVYGEANDQNLGRKSRKHATRGKKTALNREEEEPSQEHYNIQQAGNNVYLSVGEEPRTRKKSTSYEQKADLYMPKASELQRNMFAPEQNQSPTHKKNQQFTLKPHQQQPQYRPHNQHVRNHQLQHTEERYPPKKVEKQPIQPVNMSSDRKKVRRLPSVNENRVSNNLLSLHDSSTIVLHTTQVSQAKQHITDSIQNLQEESIDNSLKDILEVIQSKTTLNFTRMNDWGINYIHPDYRIIRSDLSTIIAAKKEYGHFNSYYSINVGQIVVGNLQGNFGGTEFNLYRQHGGNEELVTTIIYHADCAFMASYRTMEVYIKNSNSKDLVLLKSSQQKNLKELFEQGYSQEIRKLVTKTPTYNHQTHCYNLSFGGKSRLPSTKNMILVPPKQQKKNSLLFCKTNTNSFHLQLNNSFSIFTAMGVLMSSFDFKLFCQ